MAKAKKHSDEYRTYQHLMFAAQMYDSLSNNAIFDSKQQDLFKTKERDAYCIALEFKDRCPEEQKTKAAKKNSALSDCDDDELDEIKFAKKELKKIGITGIDNPLMPVFEDNVIKFMSYGGTTDVKQCDMFVKWLDKKKASYQRDGNSRIVFLDPKALALLLKIWPDEN